MSSGSSDDEASALLGSPSIGAGAGTDTQMLGAMDKPPSPPLLKLDDGPGRGGHHGPRGSRGGVEHVTVEEDPEQLKRPFAVVATAFVLVVCSLSLYTVLMRASEDEATHSYPYDPSVVVLLAVAGKFVFSAIGTAYVYVTDASQLVPLHPRTLALFSIPAMLYIVAMNVEFVAMRYLDAPLTTVMSNLRILFAGLLARKFLKRKLETVQLFALVLLFLGVAVSEGAALLEAHNSTEMASTSSGSSSSPPSSSSSSANSSSPLGYLFGTGCMVLVCMASAGAGVMNEHLLTRSPHQSLHQSNLFLYTFMLISDTLVVAFKGTSRVSLLEGFTSTAWMLTWIMAVFGLIVSFVIRYSGVLVMHFATCLSVLITTLLSVVLFGSHVHFFFWLGALLVSCSLYIYLLKPDIICSASVLPAAIIQVIKKTNHHPQVEAAV